MAIVSESHPLAKRQKVTLEELQGYDFALPSKGLQARNAFDSMVEGKAYRINTRIELNEVNILLKLVRESNLVTIVSEATIYGVEGIHAVRLDVPGNTYEMEGCIHVLKDSYQKAVPRSLCNCSASLIPSRNARSTGCRRDLWNRQLFIHLF